MTPTPARRSRTLPVAPLLLVLAGLVGAVGCGSSTPSGPPAGSASPAVAPSLTPVPGGSTGPGASGLPSQTDTAWGRIWDALPPSFPLPPEAIPTETGEGPVSAQLSLGTSAEEAAAFMQAALEGARYSTEALSGPLEDGSIVIDSVGDTPECRVQTTLRPLSGTTLMTVRFGAECPFG